MNGFNYDQFPINVLEGEVERINDVLAELNQKKVLIMAAIGRKAVEGAS